jgi:hypothetical protein
MLLTGNPKVTHPDRLSNTSKPEYLRLPRLDFLLYRLTPEYETLRYFETSESASPATRRHISDEPNCQKARLWKNLDLTKAGK